MKKLSKYKNPRAIYLLCFALIFSALPAARYPIVYAQEDSAQEDFVQTQEAAISLDYVSSVTVDREGSVVRVYGDPGTTYSNEISVTANCTVILDHVKNDADFTVEDGREVRIVLRGNNQLANIRATGGSATLVRITGESGGGTLTANDIACSAGGTAQTGASLYIEDCAVFCQNLGCGANGANTSAWEGSANVAHATPGSNASPDITVCGANLSVSKNMACGGDGAHATGTWSATASAGGYSGAVNISGSYVTVGGNLAVGGKGGYGEMGTSYYNCKAGETRSSSPVTITDHSSVNVAGNVATQQSLPEYSNGGSQSGLHGVTVTVADSSLSAKDIASGGAGHKHVQYNVSSGSGTSYDIYGTAGGNGGLLIASNAVINCERAVCGANAGEYQKYAVSIYGDKSGDVESANHPKDGRGGSIRATDSVFTIKSYAAAKGSRWDAYPNPSVYADSTFIGGTLNGRVYGSVITTDVTSIIGGDFTASEIRNSEEATCAKCVLWTDEALAGETVSVSANALGGTVVLGGDGSMTTYLGIGKETVKLTGAGVYSGTFMVKRSASLNVFQLEPYGVINVSYDGAVIKNNSYLHTNETYDYDGDFTVLGDSEDAVLTVEEGVKRVTLEGTSFDTLNVNGSSVVTLVLSGESQLRAVNVGEHATLVIEGDGSLVTGLLGNEHGASGKIEISSGNVQAGMLGGDEGSREITIKDPAKVEAEESRVPLRDENGNLLHILELVLGSAGTYKLSFNDVADTAVLTEGETTVRKLLAAGTYAIEVVREPFCFRGNVTIREAQRIYLDDLTLYVDVSKADVSIRDGEVRVGEDTIATDAEVRITQSGDTTNAVYVEKKTASIILDGVSPDIQIYLPEDFEGLICDVGKRPIQVVSVQTGFAMKELTLYLDGETYTLTTNAQGNLSILTGRGMHIFGLTIDGLTYRCKDAISISTTENVVRLADMVLMWDVKNGGITIEDECFTAGEISGDYTGAYLIVQSDSDAENGRVTIEKENASVFLSKEVDELLQVKVTDGFTGSISKENTPLYPLRIATGCTDSAMKVILDGCEGMLRTDADGMLHLVAAVGTHALIVASERATAVLPVSVDKAGASVSFDELLVLDLAGLEAHHPITVTVGDVTAQIETDDTGSCRILTDASAKEIIVTDGGQSYRYPVVDGMPGEPQPYEPKKPDSGSGNTGNGGGSGGSGLGGSGSGSSGSGGSGSGGLGSFEGSGDGTPGTSGSAPGTATGEASGDSDGTNPSGGQLGDASGNIHNKYSVDRGNVYVKKPSIRITSSLEGVKLVKVKKKNTYQIYSRKKVRITVEREDGTKYYYKIVKKGQKNSAVAWKTLEKGSILVEDAPCGQRVFIKAVSSGGTAVKKTTGFVVDATKPTVAGVKNAAIYKGTRMVLVSDSGGVSDIKLNGKRMPKQFLVQKKGLYRLVVTDRAGNKKQVFFAVI